jgi:hypothetical protein
MESRSFRGNGTNGCRGGWCKRAVNPRLPGDRRPGNSTTDMRSRLTGANRKSGGSLTPRSRLCAPMVELVSGRVRMEVAARTSGRCRFSSAGACHLLRQPWRQLRELRENRQEHVPRTISPMRAVKMPWMTSGCRAVPLRSSLPGCGTTCGGLLPLVRWICACGRGERRPIVTTAIAEGQRLEPGAPTWRADAEAGPAGPPGSGYSSYVVSSAPSSATNTAISRAGSVALAFSLTGWADPGGSSQLSPAS